jgi:hypothetical protein
MGERDQDLRTRFASALSLSVWLLLLASTGLLGAGCGEVMTTADIPVRWGAIDPKQEGLWIVPMGELGARLASGKEIHLKRSTPVEVRLLLVNRFSKPVLVKHDLSQPLRYIEYQGVSSGPFGVERFPIIDEGDEGRLSYVFLRPAESLISWPTGPLPRFPVQSSIYVRFILYPPLGTKTMDLTFKWSLECIFYGSSEGGITDFTRTVKILYDD